MNILKRRVGELFEHVWPNEHAPNLSKGKPLGSPWLVEDLEFNPMLSQ